MNSMEISRDRNGNRVLWVRCVGARGFSIQTNQNLPRTHRDGIGPWTLPEVRAWVDAYGTDREKALMG